MTSKKTLFVLEPEIESKFRERVRSLYGDQKGALSAAINQAISCWIAQTGSGYKMGVSEKADPSTPPLPREKVDFQMVFPRASILKVIFKVIKSLGEVAVCSVHSHGFSIRLMDSRHIALIYIEYSSSDLDFYQCTTPRNFGINVDTLLKIANTFGNSEKIELYASVDDKKGLLCASANGSFLLPISEASDETVPIPKLEFQCELTSRISLLRQRLEKIKSVTDFVTFELEDEASARLHGQSENGDAQLTILGDELVKIKVKQPSKATFQLDYLLEMFKAVGSDLDACKVSFSSNMPMAVQFPLVPHISEKGLAFHSSLTYYLAPRVKD